MLTDPGDFVVDPFAGSCVTGEVCERLRRKWLCVDLEEDYLRGALGRFKGPRKAKQGVLIEEKGAPASYRVYQPGANWNGTDDPPLPTDGGRARTGK